MTKYYTHHRSCLRNRHNEGKVSQSELEGIALAETVAYVIEDDNDGPYYITELADLYTARLNELGGMVPDRIHTTRFQERILSQIPWMSGQKADRKLYIACKSTIGKAAARVLNQTPDQNACNMAQTAIHLREQLFDFQQGFSGEFTTNVLDESVPPLLSSFINMVLCGPSVKDRDVADRKSVALAIAQLLIYVQCCEEETNQISC